MVLVVVLVVLGVEAGGLSSLGKSISPGDKGVGAETGHAHSPFGERSIAEWVLDLWTCALGPADTD